MKLTSKGRKLLAGALPAWIETHDDIERDIPASDPESLRQALRALS